MWNGWDVNESDKISQNFYFPDDHPESPGWFKHMENIIHKHGLWPNEGLKAQCDGFKCISGHTNCCSHQVLFVGNTFSISNIKEAKDPMDHSLNPAVVVKSKVIILRVIIH